MWRADRTALAAATLGGAVSGYLTLIHYSGSLALCLGSGGCEVVQASRYATIGNVPVALLGAAYFVAAAALIAGRSRLGADSARLALFALSLTAALFAGYLAWIEIFTLGAICPWCVIVALCIAALLLHAARDVGLRAPVSL